MYMIKYIQQKQQQQLQQQHLCIKPFAACQVDTKGLMLNGGHLQKSTLLARAQKVDVHNIKPLVNINPF